MHDDRVCPICRAIDNYIWAFTDEVPNSLIHPEYGEVWNIYVGSQAHGHLGNNCRCHIEPKFDLKDLLETVKRFRDQIKSAYGENTP